MHVAINLVSVRKVLVRADALKSLEQLSLTAATESSRANAEPATPRNNSLNLRPRPTGLPSERGYDYTKWIQAEDCRLVSAANN